MPAAGGAHRDRTICLCGSESGHLRAIGKVIRCEWGFSLFLGRVPQSVAAWKAAKWSLSVEVARDSRTSK